jgi:hypothetical protein
MTLRLARPGPGQVGIERAVGAKVKHSCPRRESRFARRFRELFRLDNPYRHDDPAVFARGYVRSVTAWGRPLLLRAFAREGEDRAPGLLADFLGELGERVADAPDRYRWDYIEALVICRKADGTGRDRTCS